MNQAVLQYGANRTSISSGTTIDQLPRDLRKDFPVGGTLLADGKVVKGNHVIQDNEVIEAVKPIDSLG